jgi:hypothetical protein
VQKVSSEAVITGQDGDTLPLAYGNPMGRMVEAIKELRGRVAHLEALIES